MVINLSYVYILLCQDHSLYTGWTVNLDKRLETHNKGKGAKYTRGRIPVKLVYYEEFEDKTQALKREYAIKQLKRKDKLNLIESFTQKTVR